jgi:hypothetical protein
MEELSCVQMDADAGHVSFVQSAAAARESKAEVILSSWQLEKNGASACRKERKRKRSATRQTRNNNLSKRLIRNRKPRD